MGKVIGLQEIKDKRELKEKLCYILGFVEGRFPEADSDTLFDLLFRAFIESNMSIETIKEFAFLWDNWSDYKAIIENCIKYSEEQRSL